MRRLLRCVTLVATVTAAFHTAAPGAVAAPAPSVYTPVLATVIGGTSPTPVLGTDRRQHLLYELRLTNRGRIPATLEKIEVLDFDTGATIFAFEGTELQTRIRDTGGVAASDAAIEAGGERLFLIDLSFRLSTPPPLAIEHRLNVLGPRGPRATQPTPVSYVVATVPLDGPAPPVLVPPVGGNGWVVTNGCCDVGNPHRSAVLPVNGVLWSPLRFAVELMQLDDDGQFVHDDPTQLANFTSYGRDVFAVAAGQVVALLDSVADQPGGQVQDPDAASFESAGGNYVVVDIGDGTFAFYGNLQPGSLTVKVGDRVQRREVLATIGNSSEGGFPHLHFRLMSDPSPFASDGSPFVLNAFSYEGQLDVTKFFVEGVAGNYLDSRVPNPIPRRRELPLGLAIVDFSTAGGSGAAGRT